jgi:hypothetical protein
MQSFSWKWILVFVCGISLLTFLFVHSRSAYRQGLHEVVLREPGQRLLGPPKSDSEEAKKDLVFAWMSQAVYGKGEGRKNHQIPTCQDAETALGTLDWIQWPQFYEGQIPNIDKSHLRVQIWYRKASAQVVVAFGGTDPHSAKDWESNFRWFIPFRNDEYTKIVGDFGPAFRDEFLKRKKQKEFAFLDHATLYATGHSLGAGLAQQFAYALPVDSGVPRVTQVFAFDPTPVTGFSSVDKMTRELNEKSLSIDRIYERREILANLRAITNFFHKPSAYQPTIRQVRYNLFPTINIVSGHSMPELACQLDKDAQH